MTSWSDIWWWPTNNLLETTQTLCAHTNDCQIMPKKRTHTHWWYPLLQFDSNALLNCQIRFDGFQAFGFSSHIHEFTKSSYIHLQFCVVLNFMWQHQVKGLMYFYMYLYVFMISLYHTSWYHLSSNQFRYLALRQCHLSTLQFSWAVKFMSESWGPSLLCLTRGRNHYLSLLGVSDLIMDFLGCWSWNRSGKGYISIALLVDRFIHSTYMKCQASV